jgi:hypothetical protein
VIGGSTQRILPTRLSYTWLYGRIFPVHISAHPYHEMHPEEGGEIHVQEKAKGVCRTGIAGIREKRSQGSDGRIASSDGEKIDRDGGRNPWGHFHCLLSSTVHALYP